MQLIPTGLLALAVHLALALGQPVRNSADSSPEISCMKATNEESRICMPNAAAQAAAPMMEMAHERKWIFRNSHQQQQQQQQQEQSDDAAIDIDIDRTDASIQPILPPSPTATTTVNVTPTPSTTSTCTGSPYGDYSGYGDYGEYASYGDYDADVVSQALRLD
ncbi:hypothetical protein ASPSYDRAFT_34092 [Aspergillus sydowii CBS 593.65]|uniref:Uncharacterized protein n=1 Tax=Aspergillus sydowii CBS 593.65 TaxID=1036612 RepID=A0A1L9T9L9_9EURO|nr:uncharacterized protein ASPSYDRAFT_34092 [Aspergillus sydowii CBS 593.65]OJJ56091.1 hypothetical protein ASPSYDRAFT_34092 [Aspergillus sydowii CBS 593.65]